MRRASNLYEQIADRENLRLAFSKAISGKRSRSDVRLFTESLEANLTTLRQNLLNESLTVGHCRQFVIHDPKERVITAPCFEDRVLHHAIMNICEPVFERFLIADTFACRVGKGRIAALQRAIGFSRRFPMVVRLDMRKYFNSIPHEELKNRLQRLFKDRPLLQLFGSIIDAHDADSASSFAGRKGLPIGSLTSQHLANSYLGWFDHFVKERLRVKGYIRYMDDCILWGETRDQLCDLKQRCRLFLKEELGLECKSDVKALRTKHGFTTLGCRVYPDHLKLDGRSRRRFRKRLRDVELDLENGQIYEAEAQQRTVSLIAFTTAAGVRSWKFRQGVIEQVAGE